MLTLINYLRKCFCRHKFEKFRSIVYSSKGLPDKEVSRVVCYKCNMVVELAK